MAKLHFYYSAMNAGKSTTLLQSSYNYNERGMDTLLYLPAVVSPHSENKIVTRIGLNMHAYPIMENLNLLEDVKNKISANPNIKCMLVDEAQFLHKKHITQLCAIADELNIPVLAYGLRTDFRGEPFEGSLYLLAWADILIELKTICHCGKKATMNLRLDEQGKALAEGEQVEIGGNERYMAVCRKHFRLGQSSATQTLEPKVRSTVLNSI